jgi:virginiamycin B lyase
MAGTAPGTALAATPTIDHLPIATAGTLPVGIALGPDGNMWFAERSPAGIARITPTGAVTEFRAGLTSANTPFWTAAGPDGNVWFTESTGNRVGRMSVSGTNVVELPIPGRTPLAIVAGPDGNLWYNAFDSDTIGRVTTSGAITEFPVTPNSDPARITVGPDGNLWFTEAGGRIGRITTSGVVREFSAGITAGSSPVGIGAGPDGNVWFTESTGTRIGRITPSGQITEFPGVTPGAGANDIKAGLDGALYFTERDGDRIGRITTSGQIQEFALPAGSAPQSIALGPDGRMWFVEAAANRIGRITTPPKAVTGGASAAADTTATVTGTVNAVSQATTFHFDFGTTSAYGSRTAESAVGSGSRDQRATGLLTGLDPGTTYHYRLVTTNATGTTTGADATVTTTAPPTAPPVDSGGTLAPAQGAFPGPSSTPVPVTAARTTTGRVDATVAFFFTAFRTYTRVGTLTPKQLRVGDRVEVICRGGRSRGCPLTSVSFTVRKPGALNLKKVPRAGLSTSERRDAQRARRLFSARLRAGAQIELRILRAAAIGSVRRFTIRAGKLPTRETLCLPPGAREAQKRCA